MRVLVVDDEPIARARLIRLLRQIEGTEAIGEAGDGHEAIALARELRPDVLLLDIDLPNLDGISVAENPSAPPVIFTTAHKDYALDAFEANAYDYLLKPVSKERLERALARVAARRGETHDAWRLVVTDGSIKRFVDAREVESFVAVQKYVSFRFDGRELLIRESLDALEARLGAFGFLRVNRGALVRRTAITAYDASGGGSVLLQSGERIPVSRRAAPNVRAALGLA